ncbi:DUF676-domain-containing protein [Auriscalpium vulgare]|uniref:DUF676-domain-containing protein n=1 Tax=Auriscalpium vulgare TaxID=40419 RepID=A0ACB8S4E2_9AGAM|nr:DUF676-domain-containing protein [Auriscalpium vulgare]
MSSSEVHLLVLIHGMWGNPSHLASMYRIFHEQRVIPQAGAGSFAEPRLHVLLAETNKDESTYDGIDWGAERVAKEVFDEIAKIEKDGQEKVTRFSVTGYSLGGLLARYLVGILKQRGTFETITPVNFNTIATPHIGLLTYPSFFSRLASYLGPKLLSRTGEQFYAVDKWSKHGRPLLEVMADPDRVFYQGLTQFKHIRIYANAVNDMTVPYITAAFETEDPFLNHVVDGLDIEYDEKYKPVVKSWSIPTAPPPPPPKPTVFTPAWFKSYTPPLPPRLQLPFPYNIAIIALVPILFPTFLTLIIIRLSLSSHSSRSRIKRLEAEGAASASERLAHIVGELEREMEDMVVDYVEDSAPTAPSTPADSDPAVADPVSASAKPHTKRLEAPRTSPAQRKMIAALNALPGLKKERVFIGDVRNSHATIIARDVQSFEFHRIGEGVLRHWADAFIA